MANTENKQPTCRVYRVDFKQRTPDDTNLVTICDNIPQMEMAVKIALSIHECSNTAHTIHVMHDDLIDVTFIRYDQSTNV